MGEIYTTYYGWPDSIHVFPQVGHKTASFGVTAVMPKETVGEALQRADQALYQAKDSGRNKVVCQ